MSVHVSKFAKKKENSSSVTINNSSRGYSNTNNNYTASQLDRMLWNIHDTGQDINEPLTLPALSVNGTITAGGRITSGTDIVSPNGHIDNIYADNIYSEYIDNSELITTKDLRVNHTAEIENLISTNITTEYLNVTKSAHFTELIIDKIKSVGGAAVFTPADGFKLATEDDIIQIYTQNKTATNYWMLCWDAEDDRGKTVNIWEIGDQALCQNFNEAVTGTSYDVSNTYYWMLVRGKGTYDPNADTPETVQYDNGSAANSMSMLNAYDSEGNLITFDTPKHYIIVYNYPALYTDALSNTYVQKDGNFDPKPGQDIVMLGHRAQTDEVRNSEYKKRQSAIYIAAYDSGIETELVAPLIAQYEGVKDFRLSMYRTTWFAAGNNAVNGYANQVKGNFLTVNGSSLDDLSGTTYFIRSDKAYIPVTSNWELSDAYNITLDCMYIAGDNAPEYIGNHNLNYSLKIYYKYNGTEYSSEIAYTHLQSSYTFDLRQLIVSNTNGYIDDLRFEICKVDGLTRTCVYSYSIPVIPNAGGEPGSDGDDANFYKLNSIKELAQIDVEGNFALYLQYQVQHITGSNITIADNTDYSIQFVIWDEDNNIEQTKTIPYSNGYFTYDKDGNPSYEKTNVFDRGGQRTLLHDQYIEVSLIKNNGSVMIDKRIIPITLVAGAMFSVTDSITARVTSSESTLTDHTSRIGQLELDSEHFASEIEEINTTLSEQGDSIDSLEQNTSYIRQYADSINTRVENTRTEFNNAYAYITSNYSTIQQTNDQISLYVNSEVTDQMTGITETLRRTGIDITSYNITLNGDTIVNGTLDLNSGEGFNLNNEDGSLGAKIHGGEIPNISDWKSSNSSTTSLVRTYTDQKYFENTETSQEFTLNYNKFDLGYHQPLDQITINEIIITSNFPISGSGTFNITDGTDILATRNISSLTLVSSSVYYRYRVTLNWTYTSNVSARQLYGGYELNLTGTPRINTNNFSFRLNYTVTANKLIEIGSNGLATRVDTDDYMYMGESAFEVRHGNNGLQVYNSDGHIPASGQYGYGVKRYYNDISQNGWFPILTPSLYVLSGSSFLWNNYSYDMVITLYSSSSADVTIYLPTDRWRGRICYIRKAGVSNVIVYTSGSDYMYLSQASGRTNVSNLTIQNGDMYMFVYTGQGTETVGRWVVNRIPNP